MSDAITAERAKQITLATNANVDYILDAVYHASINGEFFIKISRGQLSAAQEKRLSDLGYRFEFARFGGIKLCWK
jgi:hypothetical protein